MVPNLGPHSCLGYMPTIGRYNILKRGLAKVLDRLRRSHRINEADREIVEALQRLFILDPPKTDDPEDEYDYTLLRQVFALLALMTIFRLFLYVSGIALSVLKGVELPPEMHFDDIYSGVATISFTWLFVMLHFETKQTSVILLLLTWAGCCLSLW